MFERIVVAFVAAVFAFVVLSLAAWSADREFDKERENLPDPFKQYENSLAELNQRDPEGKDEVSRAVLRNIYLTRVLTKW